jgi:hypothetical protein
LAPRGSVQRIVQTMSARMPTPSQELPDVAADEEIPTHGL